MYRHYDAQLCLLSKPIADNVNLMSSIDMNDDGIRLLAIEASIGMPGEAIQSENDINLASKMGAKLLELYLSLQRFQK